MSRMTFTETYKQATRSSLCEEARGRRALADSQSTTNTPNLSAPITHSSANTRLPSGSSADDTSPFTFSPLPCLHTDPSYLWRDLSPLQSKEDSLV